MPVAEYTGSAAQYRIGPHVFLKDNPDTLKQTVDDNIAGFLRENPSFIVDGKGGVRTKASEDEPEDRPIIPADGFKSRDEAAAFATKWLPNFKLDMSRSTAECQRRIEAELQGLKVDEQGEITAPNAAVIPQVPDKKEAPTKKVTV